MKSPFRTHLAPIRSLSHPAKLLILAFFLDGLLFSGFNLFLNIYIIQAGFSRDFLGLINAMPSISALIFTVPMGLLSDRMGRKRAMLLGLTVADLDLLPPEGAPRLYPGRRGTMTQRTRFPIGERVPFRLQSTAYII